MIKQELGQIKQVDLRDVFEKEDKDFTPWLKEHLHILEEKLGLDIIDSETEVRVGNLICDIVAKDAESNRAIIIENQFGTSDHEHLGKILTYAAHKDANTIIWIAENFRDEHKKVLEWLNEKVDPETGPSFFAVEIKLIKINDSPPAPCFREVVKPNKWERRVKVSSRLIESERGRKYLDFFSKLVEEYEKINPGWRKVKAQPQNWLKFSAGRSGLSFEWLFKGNNIFAVRLNIDTEDENENERIFKELEKYKDEMEREIGELKWDRKEGRRARRIEIWKEVKGDIKELSEEDCAEIREWACKTMKEFSMVMSKYLNEIDIST